MNPHDLTNLADAVGASCHTHSMGRATSIMFSIQQLEQFAERLLTEKREKRIAALAENEALRLKLARSGLEQNRAVHAAILKERETIVQILKAHMVGVKADKTLASCLYAVNSRNKGERL